MVLDVRKTDFMELNNIMKNIENNEIKITNVLGQSYIGSGVKNKLIYVEGVPGNALGANLNDSEIYVQGNCQDTIGDTMNNGKIVVYGNCGDAVGYSMRGGEIYIKGNAGDRAGIHMKKYNNSKPIIVIGGKAGNFLGEYQAGGVIIVLGIGTDTELPIGAFCGTGMYDGEIYIRSDKKPENLPAQIVCEEVNDISEIKCYLKRYSRYFSEEFEDLYEELIYSKYYKLSPNAKNPYKQLYVEN